MKGLGTEFKKSIESQYEKKLIYLLNLTGFLKSSSLPARITLGCRLPGGIKKDQAAP